jgi:hypothetical protein
LTGDNTVISIDGDATGAATNESNGVSTGASTEVALGVSTVDETGAGTGETMGVPMRKETNNY